ncbi:hypothetical protein D3273_14600 [Lichenibacterium minor]|uniref:DUF2946 domain-containing protein n=1 Tax=Lichenibacterium minor TaxID=2316528 RepID=A0A4Q2U883_9HYPH|nr:hypothetical protein [Lichenibacterium minor]RYC31341.1 hypothetical protein D3273_14600 [Lichenibacterium minor]
MFPTWIKAALLCLALVAGSIVAGHAGSGLDQHGAASVRLSDRAADADVAATHQMQRHAADHHGHGAPDRDCPTGGGCCDAFCHAVLATDLPMQGTVDVSFGAYLRRDDAAAASLPVRGPERPPRSAVAGSTAA